MAKMVKGSKIKGSSRVKKLASTEQKMSAKDMKKVRGGDFNADGIVDAADFVKKKAIQLKQ